MKDLPEMSEWLRRFGVSAEDIINKRISDAKRAELEINNTKLPVNKRAMAECLRELCMIPRMSTFAIGAIINQAVLQMHEDCCFVNVGVWHGFTLLAGMQRNPRKRCVGVDNFSEFGGPRERFMERFDRYKSANHYFYEMDYKDYFANVHQGRIGVYIYDGEHSYNNQLDGLLLAEPYFSENCIILVDDTNLEPTKQATRNFIASGRQKYRILLDKTTAGDAHPSWWNGIMVLQRVG